MGDESESENDGNESDLEDEESDPEDVESDPDEKESDLEEIENSVLQAKEGIQVEEEHQVEEIEPRQLRKRFPTALSTHNFNSQKLGKKWK